MELGRSLGVSPFLAQLLISRGIASPDSGRRFLQPELEHLHDPMLLPDAGLAVDRIVRAVQEGERILIHGDYDVDGCCAAALMTRVLKVLKGNVEAFVPHRQEEGYDLQPGTVRRAAAEGVRLIVTVDCGTVAFEAAEAAREVGIDLIITDHHEPSPCGNLPKALAVVNPKRPGSQYPFHELCGTGVAFKLCTALVDRAGITSKKFRTAFLDLVALATCADCMPLVDENRVFVSHGLRTLRATSKIGLKALMRVANVGPDDVNTRCLGFTLGPRINAIGRMDAARHALQLLLATDEAEAKSLAEKLDLANTERQMEQEKILQEAIRQTEHFLEDRILVLDSPKWHPGIIGIVASKIVESLCRPTVMISVDEENGRGRGSCRSIEGFHIFEALHACREHLGRCGGHQAAAGFDIDVERISALREALQQYASTELPEELLQPSVRADGELPPGAIGLRLADELLQLEPFGHGNPEPVFLTRDLTVVEQNRLTNRNGGGVDHMKLRVLTSAPRRGLDVLFWRAWPRAEECPLQSRIDACYTLEINRYNDRLSLQLNLRDFRPCAG